VDIITTSYDQRIRRFSFCLDTKSITLSTTIRHCVSDLNGMCLVGGNKAVVAGQGVAVISV